ncbi:excinuclease ABC subunit UvrA, partial [Candidatus Falkowbacteria bacterium]|nr:excinuclease ABC subunit UvrA [Candidatus Falkowbacteria bacterium]
TEIYDYLRLLFARVGEPRCPQHGVSLHAQTISQMVDQVLALPAESKAMILAPVVRDRKGEHVQLLQQLQARGYVRARIDGEIYELDDPPKLNLRQKHTIDVVVDRFKVRADLAPRLSESFENALNLADGLVVVAAVDGAFPDTVFSSKFACAKCGYSLSELEPRLFSFNNPVGACPECDGLGVDQFFDPARVVHDETLSLADGAIRGWDRRTNYYYTLLESLASHYHFSIDDAFCDLPEDVRERVLYGSGQDVIEFHYQRPHGGMLLKKHPFEGIIPNMQRRYRESDSATVREELAKYLATRPCQSCHGARLREAARHVFIDGKNLPEIAAYSIDQSYAFFKQLKLTGYRGEIAEKINKEIVERLGFLVNVGLDYLSLTRSAETLSGGEAQRIRLASQIGSGLVGVMYILDEPSIGLHQRDNDRLLKTLLHLRDLGNTVIVVEHDEEAIRMADYVLDIGPGAGVHGGEIVAFGSPQAIIDNEDSLTGQYLSGKQSIAVPKTRIPFDDARVIHLKGVTCNNLQNVDVRIPLGLTTCITGVSGSGKSSLINDTLYPMAANKLNRASLQINGKLREITGLELCDKVIDIDQSPIGRTPRSNPATYTGIFSFVRDLYASLPEARVKGFGPGHFSFNVPGGRCENCSGDGSIKVEMQFLADVYLKCELCDGQKFKPEILAIKYKEKNIFEVLEMTVSEAELFFNDHPQISQKLKTLNEVGLGYIKLGQSATTFSGGEAQRIKLATELSRRSTGKTLYILDEPTTGLHFEDIERLLKVLNMLVDCGNTVLIIEHNLEVIRSVDWIIDLGPDGGEGGGEIVAVGNPKEVAREKKSFTGKYLREMV